MICDEKGYFPLDKMNGRETSLFRTMVLGREGFDNKAPSVLVKGLAVLTLFARRRYNPPARPKTKRVTLYVKKFLCQ